MRRSVRHDRNTSAAILRVIGDCACMIRTSQAATITTRREVGYDSFPKTLSQWIDSAGHRRNLLLHGASRVGVASAKSATTGRTYWAMEIAGGYERSRSRLPSAKPPTSRHAEQACRMKILGLCL